MKMLKPEIEFIKFNTEDVITTSGEVDPVSGDPSKNMFNDTPLNVVDDNTEKSLTRDFGGLSWNMNQ